MTKHHKYASSQSIVNSILTHILSSTSWIDQIINEIQKNVYPVIIAGSEFNQNWPKALIYGNHNIRTLKLKYLETEKMIRKIDIIHKFLTLSDYSNRSLSLIDNYQIVAGI